MKLSATKVSKGSGISEYGLPCMHACMLVCACVWWLCTCGAQPRFCIHKSIHNFDFTYWANFLGFFAFKWWKNYAIEHIVHKHTVMCYAKGKGIDFMQQHWHFPNNHSDLYHKQLDKKTRPENSVKLTKKTTTNRRNE